jgi:hypothetical protein
MLSPLQKIPAAVRTQLYWVGYCLGIVGQGVTIIWGAIAAASPDVSMPLGIVIASAVLGFVQTQLNLLAGSNVSLESNTIALSTPGTVESVNVSATTKPATEVDTPLPLPDAAPDASTTTYEGS